MKLHAPRQITWWTAAIIGGFGTLLQFRIIQIDFLSPLGAWMVIIGMLLLILGTAVDFL